MNKTDYGNLIQTAETNDEEKYIHLLVIRKFEENLLRLFGENKLFGTTHTCIGQEAVAVGVMTHVEESDIIFSNHRCHGHFIAYSHHPDLLLKEIMGKENGLCGGRGGSQHIYYRNFYSNGVQGGIVPNAIGAALSEKRKENGNIVIVFLGDGTLGQGVVYESLNIAGLMKLPVLFIVENNGYAMSTKTAEAVSGSISARADAFGIEVSETDGNIIDAVQEEADKAIKKIRKDGIPFMLICNTYRLAAHSKGDDIRSADEIEEHKKHDPVILAGQKLSEDRRIILEGAVESYISLITEKAEKEDFGKLDPVSAETDNNIDLTPIEPKKRYVDYINYALAELLKKKDTIILGEDIRDPYGGAFKVTKGLSTKYPDQVINTPISEASIVGMAVGAALNGTRTIVEIMFGDFVSLCFDQILNHASKYSWVYRSGKRIPMIIRTPMGGKRGYGPTHSQSLEKYLSGIPGVNVVALSAIHNPVFIYRYVFGQNDPTIVIENKLLYTRHLLEQNERGMIGDFYVRLIHNHLIPSYLLSCNPDFSNDITIITYGGMVEDCMQAARALMIDDEISVNILVLGQLFEVPDRDLTEINDMAGTVVFVEEGTFSFGVGAEILCRMAESNIGKKYARVAAPDSPLPNSLIQELQLLPGADTIIEKVRSLL